MADEVSTGELGRRLDEVLRTVRDLPGRGEYNEYQRHSEHRFTEIERDLERERVAREAADKALHERMDKAGTNTRQNVFQGLLPSVLVLASIAVSVLLAFRGG